jgi:hypothetical protein
MTTSLRSLIAAVVVLSSTFPGVVPAGTQDSVVFYVAPNGNDAWSGERAAPDAIRKDGPFSTFQRARDAARKCLASGGHPSVFIRGGIYRFDSTLTLGPEDFRHSFEARSLERA